MKMYMKINRATGFLIMQYFVCCFSIPYYSAYCLIIWVVAKLHTANIFSIIVAKGSMIDIAGMKRHKRHKRVNAIKRVNYIPYFLYQREILKENPPLLLNGQYKPWCTNRMPSCLAGVIIRRKCGLEVWRYFQILRTKGRLMGSKCGSSFILCEQKIASVHFTPTKREIMTKLVMEL